MTGQEHYTEAERLIDSARGAHGDLYDDTGLVSLRLAEAQVHATLALAAATRDAARASRERDRTIAKSMHDAINQGTTNGRRDR